MIGGSFLMLSLWSNIYLNRYIIERWQLGIWFPRKTHVSLPFARAFSAVLKRGRRWRDPEYPRLRTSHGESLRPLMFFHPTANQQPFRR